jgi:hypothetical protein
VSSRVDGSPAVLSCPDHREGAADRPFLKAPCQHRERSLTYPHDILRRVPHVFGSELTSMIEDGAGLVVGTVGDDGEPRATRAWSAIVADAEQRRLRVVVGADDPVTVANLRVGTTMALNGADVRTFRSIQLKGTIVAVDAAGSDDVDAARSQSDRFLQAVHDTDGNPLEQLRRILPIEVVAIEMVVDEMYDQTPGPEAGGPLRAP